MIRGGQVDVASVRQVFFLRTCQETLLEHSDLVVQAIDLTLHHHRVLLDVLAVRILRPSLATNWRLVGEARCHLRGRQVNLRAVLMVASLQLCLAGHVLR